MGNKISNRFKTLEENRYQLFTKLKNVNEDILNNKIDETKWSIIQIIHHLYKSEQLSIVYIKRKLRDKSKIKKSGIASWVRGLILEWALRFPTKLKAPSNVSDVPDFAKLDIYENKWKMLRKDLSEIIENTDTKLLLSDIFKHPAVGETNMVYALKFMQAHFNHHKKQIDKILLINNKFV